MIVEFALIKICSLTYTSKRCFLAMPFDAGKVACWRHHRSSPLLVLYVFWLLMMPPSWSPIVSPLRRHGPPTSSLYIYALSPSNSCYYSTVRFTLPSRHIALSPTIPTQILDSPTNALGWVWPIYGFAMIHLVQSRDVVLSFDPLFLLPSRLLPTVLESLTFSYHLIAFIFDKGPLRSRYKLILHTYQIHKLYLKLRRDFSVLVPCTDFSMFFVTSVSRFQMKYFYGFLHPFNISIFHIAVAFVYHIVVEYTGCNRLNRFGF
ncbi:LOW QUALITY PROTEIN: hypothetical protein HID58_025766 [Brassica napus]|uniref:Uncharacterized protein n=1 Tax=Brassica napus TaxID=3708 RepID=A0ABQ8CM53_BRANA|nr:LOW QUALITY PROTEIN: hypothetical protein HID58_025766 [Brassica napus]